MAGSGNHQEMVGPRGLARPEPAEGIRGPLQCPWQAEFPRISAIPLISWHGLSKHGFFSQRETNFHTTGVVSPIKTASGAIGLT